MTQGQIPPKVVRLTLPAFGDFYVNNQFLYGTFLQNNLSCCYCDVFANICHHTHGVNVCSTEVATLGPRVFELVALSQNS